MKLKKFLEYNMINDAEFTIYCDMDGVLTDFERRFREIKHNKKGLNPDEFEKVHGKFSMWELIGEEGLEWWSEMDWMPDGKDLWNHIKKYDPTILSSPSRRSASRKGKKIWVERELGINQESATVSPKSTRWDENSRLILASEKFLFNKRYPNSILIDDTENQINNWVNNGGIGILHTSAKDTIKQLEEIIKGLHS